MAMTMTMTIIIRYTSLSNLFNLFGHPLSKLNGVKREKEKKKYSLIFGAK